MQTSNYSVCRRRYPILGRHARAETVTGQFGIDNVAAWPGDQLLDRLADLCTFPLQLRIFLFWGGAASLMHVLFLIRSHQCHCFLKHRVDPKFLMVKRKRDTAKKGIHQVCQKKRFILPQSRMCINRRMKTGNKLKKKK